MKSQLSSFLISVLLLCSVCVNAQNRISQNRVIFENLFYEDVIPVSVIVEDPVQGFAVHGRYAFSFHDKGLCVVYDLRKQCYLNSFRLDVGSAHCNSANFGRKKSPFGFPYLYVSECGGGNACYVCEVSTDTIKVVQTIRYESDDADRYFDWCVDAKRGLIYTYGGQHMLPKNLRSFIIPDVEEENVVLTSDDVIDRWSIPDVMIAQGNCIRKGHLYLPDGPVPEQNAENTEVRAIHVFDLASGLTETWKLYAPFSHEPEDISVFRGKIYLQDYSGVPVRGGRFYRIRLK